MNDFALLARHTGESDDDWGLRLLDHLTACFRSSARPLVETYLVQVPGLNAEIEVALDLVTAEWMLRRMAAENISLAEYIQRFPAWEQELRMLWEIDQRTPLPTTPLESPEITGEAWKGFVSLPATFGNYRLLQEFNGGMAHVFLAEPVAGGDAVALKTPRLPPGHDAKTLSDQALRRERFLQEVRFVQQLDGPGLCRILEVGESAGLPYFTMPFYPGKSVREELLARGTFPERDAAQMIADVARAVQAAHDKGILHRDLKPANLLRDAEGRVVVTDFGLAIPLDDPELRLTNSGNIPGTPVYFSPEQAQGQRDLTPASDIFSLGVILYELLAGRPPFSGNVIELLRTITEAEPTPLQQVQPTLSPALVAICRKAMARQPGDRYASMTAFADDLKRFSTAPGLRQRQPNRQRSTWLRVRGCRAIARLSQDSRLVWLRYWVLPFCG